MFGGHFCDFVAYIQRALSQRARNSYMHQLYMLYVSRNRECNGCLKLDGEDTRKSEPRHSTSGIEMLECREHAR
jgi:hypothetical protein